MPGPVEEVVALGGHEGAHRGGEASGDAGGAAGVDLLPCLVGEEADHPGSGDPSLADPAGGAAAPGDFQEQVDLLGDGEFEAAEAGGHSRTEHSGLVEEFCVLIGYPAPVLPVLSVLSVPSVLTECRDDRPRPLMRR